ncbi:MAG: DUF308 domain-containing protein [Lachnospiraceae bacterium]|nr:DUF308 domain-containing protein [Lachnospiraceae bacterium]
MWEELIEKMRSIRLHMTASALICVILGVVLLIWPTQVTALVAYFIGGLLIVIGGIQVIGKIFNDNNRSSGLLVGLVVLAIGVWIILQPTKAVSFIPIVIGVVLVVSGVQNLSLAISGKRANADRWGLMIASAILSIVFGVLCVACAFGVIKLVMRLVGLALIYDGISSMLMVHHVNMAERAVDSVILREEDVDDF